MTDNNTKIINADLKKKYDDDKISKNIKINDETKDKKDKEESQLLVKDLETKIESAEQEAKESHDRLLRVSAEFENYKKRSQREVAEFRKYANESLINTLLPLVDNLERAINSSSDDDASNRNLIDGVVDGVEMTLKETLKIFKKFGVQPIESLGKNFDPNLHEAVMQKESENAKENIVLEEFQKGYMIHDRLLRPAMVVVSKGKDKNDTINDTIKDNQQKT